MLSFDEVKKNARSQMEKDEKRNQAEAPAWDSLKDRARSQMAQNSADGYNDFKGWFAGIKDLSNRAGSYYSKGGYIAPTNEFDSDIDRYLTKAGAVKSYISANKNAFSNYDDVVKAYDEAISYLTGLKEGVAKANDHFSQWKSEDDYNFWEDHGTLENRQKWYKEQQAKVDELGGFLDNYYTIELWYQDYQERPWEYTEEEVSEKLALYNQHKAVKQKYATAEDLKDEIKAIESDMRNYERGNYNEKGQYYGSKVIDDYQEVTKRPDFAVTSANRDYNNPTKEELWEYDISERDGSLALNGGGYSDEEGNIYDARGNLVTKANAPEIHDKLGLFLESGDEGINEAYNRLMASNGNYNDTWADIMQEGDHAGWKYLEPSEIEIYYALMDESQEAAYKFLSDIEPELNRRENEAAQAYIEEAPALEKVFLNAASIPMSVIGGGISFVDDAIHVIRGEEINPYSRTHAWSNAASAIRADTAKNINEITGNVSLPYVGTSFGDVYQSIMSVGDMAFGAWLGGAEVYSVLMGTGAATAEAKVLYEQGASMEQIVAGSTLAGAAEMVFERVSIENLINMKDAKAMSQVIKNLLIQGGIEASEEAATEISNTITNAIVMGKQSNWQGYIDKYLANGDSEAQAAVKALFNDVAPNVINAAIGGFISGEIGGGASSAASYGQYKQQATKTGKTIMEADGGVDALKKLANDVAGVSDAKMKRELTKQSGKVSSGTANNAKNSKNAFRVGRLYDTVQEANNLSNAPANQADISKSLQRKGFNAETANDIASALVARYNGQELTKAQEKLLKSVENSKVVRDAISNIMTNEQSTMGQRSRNIRDFQNNITRGRITKAITETIRKNTTAEQFTPAGEYEVSDSGKAINTESGDDIDIKGVSAISKGKMVLELADGTTIDAKSVSFASESDALIYEAIANLGDNINAETANKLITKYDGSNAEVFARGIAQAYTYGFYGLDRTEMTGEHSLATELTKEQRNLAYGLGEKYRSVKDQADKAKARARKAPGEKGVFYRDKDGNATDIRSYLQKDGRVLNEMQTTGIEFMEKMSKMMGVRFNVFEGWEENGTRYYLDENGEKTEGSPNGFYDPKTGEIYIDLFAGNDFQGTMLFTVAHELTHFMRQWSPEHFTKIAKLVFSHAGFKGSVSSLVAVKMNGKRRLDYDTALEEVVADGMETILKDGKVAEFMADVKKTDSSVWAKLKEWFKNFAEFLKKMVDAYSGQSAQTVEGQKVADFSKKLLNQIEQIWAEGAVSAGENYQSSLTPGVESTVVNESGDPVAHATEDGTVQLSMRTYEDEGRDAFRTYLEKCVKSEKLTKAEMQEMMDGIEDIYNTCKEFKDKYAPFGNWSDAAVVRDTYGKPVFSVVTPNGEYKMNLDFSLVCKKRRTLDAVFNEMAKRGIIDNFELGQKSVVKINEIIRKHGLETACALCFVDAKRFRQASMADSFTNLYNELVESLVPEAQRSSIDHFNFSGYETVKKVDGGIDTWDDSKLDFSHINHVLKTYGDGTVEYKAAKYIKSHAEGRKLLLRGDFMSSKGFDAVKSQNPDVLKLYNSKKGTGGPKAAFGDVQYLNEIIKKSRHWTPAKAYSVGGVRIQSFSDYVPRMVFDYVQMVYDLAATKLPAHAYTKEALFVKQFGLTGIKINMSLIPAIAEGGIAPGLDANGNYVWAGESFDFETAKEIQNAEGYTENCGTICVGVSYEHIKKLLADPNIRQVIPYHKSGLNPIVAHMNRIAQFTDYTGNQNTLDKDGKKVEKDFDFSKALHKMGENADPKAVADQYLKWCMANGYTAKFAEFAEFDGYYKLLEDFTLYDANNQYVPQREVRAVFPTESSAFGSMKSLIEAGLQEDAVIEGKRDASLSSIVDEIEQTLPKTEAEIAETEVDQADRDLEADTKFSMRESVEETKDLLAYHNITEQLLWDALKRKGLLMPSLAVTNKGVTAFGEISLLFDKNTIDPIINALNKLYGADAWTPTQTELKKNAKFDTDKTVRTINTVKNRIGSKFASELFNVSPKQFKDAILKADGSIYNAYAHNIGMQTAYAMEKGIISKIPTNKDGTLNKAALQEQVSAELDTDNGWRQYKKWLRGISDDIITSYDRATNQEILNDMKAQPATAKTFKLSETGELVVPAAEYADIDTLRKNKNRLSENAEDATKAVANKFLAFAKKIDGNTKSVVDAINATFANRYSTADIVKSFKNRGINISTETASELQSLYKQAVELPTQYFEAKPGREVSLNEIKAVVMPAGESYAELKGKLEDHGITVVEYDGSKESRVEALNSMDDLKFSDRDNAPTFYSQMAKVVDGVKQEKLGAASVVSMLRGKGVKSEEIKWSGIETWLDGKKSVTKAELQEFIAGSTLRIEEHTRDVETDRGLKLKKLSKDSRGLYVDGKLVETFTKDERGLLIPKSDPDNWYYNEKRIIKEYSEMRGKTHKFSEYKLNGGKNYREIVFSLPGATYSNFAMQVHWGEGAKGILAHARVQDFKVNGKKMLFVEEIQSDWHNEGHRKGYADKGVKTDTDIRKESADAYREFINSEIMTSIESRLERNRYYNTTELFSDLFSGKEFAYITLGENIDQLTNEEKAFISQAVAEEAKRQQAIEDAPLKSKVDSLVQDAPFRDNYHEFVLKRLLRMAAEEGYDSIGWTTADIQSERWSEAYAEGYRIEYDQDIPKFLNKYGKKWGTKVGKTTLGNGTEVWSMAITDSMKDSVLTEGQPLFSYRDESPNAFNPDGKTLDEQLDEILDTSESFDGRYLYIGRFTHAFIDMVKKYVDIKDLPIAMNYRDAYLSMENKENGKYKGDGINYHNLGKEGMKSAIESFDRPEQVLLSNKDGKIELVLEGVDYKGNKLLSIVALNTVTRNAKKFIEAHIVTSIYGRRSMEKYIGKAEKEGRLIYSKKEELTQGISQVQYEGNINANSSSETTIAQNGSGVKYQDRASDSVSNRSLLANAFEGVAQNDIEKQKIQEYKDKIDLINAEEKKLHELNEQIKELSFSKGPRDTKKIKNLQFEARQTANRISTYDKQLLRLEASKPLQDVLAREKKKAYQTAEQRGKKALEAYREKATKAQKAMLEKWQESRKKGIDSRHRTAMRHKIKDVVNELNQYLLRGTKDRHVPIELQKAVAEALDAVNMDTVGAEERITKLQAELMKAKTPEQIQEISRKIDHIYSMGDRMNSRLKKLKDAYDQIINSDDPLIANSHDEVISNNLDRVINKVGNTPLRDMTLEQLEDVYDMYRMVLTSIQNANKAFKAKRNESISAIASQVMVEVEKTGGKKKLSVKGLDGIRAFAWNNLKPVYAFEHIGSNHLTEVFNNVRSGEDVWAVDVAEAREFYLDKSKKYGYDSWDFKKRYTFESASGMDFDLGLEQIMSLYAYSKRDQAAEHLKRGGIVIDETTEITVRNKLGIPVKFNPTEATAYNISDETLADIIGKLSDEQKSFVDEMQDYLSTVMGAKGNEVSMEMYGVKLFKEKFYFPLKSAQQFMAKAKEQQKGEVKIKNSGFSKETVQKASNPIVLTPFMNVWADHVNEMSMYHAFVLPLEDFYRVYNYKTPTSETMATESVEMFIQNAYGKGATKYIDQLLKDLNGGARTDSTTGIINKMIGLFKKGAVFASLSVVVQQPSAIARALALVDMKYFIGPKVDHKRHKALWEEVKQYAPVAIIKEMGYFDTNMGKSTQDFILGKEYSGFSEKMKALVTDSGYRDEVLSKAPSLADEIAWCGIWEAVKRETKAKNPGMEVKSEAFLKKAGERFTEVITKTQVYDSALSRSGMMRSKDTGMKMATAFMAEPTTSINMIADALLQGKRGNKKYARSAIGAVIAAQILNSILVSFVYAGRDDDEDETYVEKYIGTFTAEVLDGLNPATYIPFVKDIVSIVQGYDVERSDMAVISDLWKAWENLSNDNLSAYRKVEGFAGSIAQIFGLPIKNIMRDARGIYQTVDSFVNGQSTTGAGIGCAVQGAISGKTAPDYQQLYEAYLRGDTAHIERVKGRFEDQTAINNAIRKALRENDPRVRDAAVAWNANDLDEYMRIAKEIIAEKHFSQDDVVMAIRSEASSLEPDNGSSGASKAKGLFTAEKFAAAIAQGDQASALAAKIDIIDTAKRNGKSAEDAEMAFVSSAKSELKELFVAGTISDRVAINAIVSFCGKTEDEARADVQYWAFKKDYPNISVDDQWFDTYYDKIADSGIGIDVYMNYRNSVATITGEGKKERRMDIINSLPITKSQKDALYFAEGWTASKLYEAPWN